jgi:hypothetical protein
VLLNTFASFGVRPFLVTHEHIQAIAGATGLILTAALIAVPGAVAVEIIKAVSIFTTT